MAIDDRTRILLVYALALLAAIGVALGVEAHPIPTAATADALATVVVFGFSAVWRNASVYDPYWSVAPPLIGGYWLASGPQVGNWMAWMILALVAAWSVRLTGNWVLRWRGLQDEDWRYVELRRRHGKRFVWVNFWGIHALPTALVLAGCLPLYAALADRSEPFGPLDLVAAGLTLVAIWIEADADRQLRRHRNSPGRDRILDRGWWARCRYPNYLGEMGFWWGLYLFGLAANPDWWWTGIGALSITALFVFVSIPMMDKRHCRRRPGYEQHIDRVPALWLGPRDRRGD